MSEVVAARNNGMHGDMPGWTEFEMPEGIGVPTTILSSCWKQPRNWGLGIPAVICNTTNAGWAF
jgi:hypothetical protein